MAIPVLLCYDQSDKNMVKSLKKHLSTLVHKGQISLRDHDDILPGTERADEIRKQFDEAQIILLLISASFLASQYYYGTDVPHAVERHESKGARVIPVLLSPVYWDTPPFDKLKALPDYNKPIRRWRPQDEGFTNVVEGIVKVIEQWKTDSLPGMSPGREAFVKKFEQLIKAVQEQMQPQPRALATASTLQQLSVFVPSEVTLADLIAGWRILSQSSLADEPGNVVQRRVTCGELAQIAEQFSNEPGNMSGAIKTWRVWRDMNQYRDPRSEAMVKTFARELAELEAAAR